MTQRTAARLALKFPIEFGDTLISELNFRRIKVKDLRQADKEKDDLDAGMQLLGRLTGMTPAQLDELDMDDLAEALKIVAGFTEKLQKTGGKSSDGSAAE